MATAKDIVVDALKRSGIIESETPIEDSEVTEGLKMLNDWGSMIESSVVQLGFVPLANSTDTINIPRDAELFYKTNLAIYIAGDYGAPLPQSLLAVAKDSRNATVNRYTSPPDVAFPETLPVGSGNECDAGYFDDRFFGPDEKVNF